jgi:2-isopropylmalate synthase
VVAQLRIGDKTQAIRGEGNGPIDAFVSALRSALGVDLHVLDYSEHSLGKGAKAQAVAYVQAQLADDISYGVGRHESILTASMLAVLSAANRLRKRAEKRQSLRPAGKPAAAQ